MYWNTKYINANNNSECDHTHQNLKTNYQDIVYIKVLSHFQLIDPWLILLSYHTV